MEIRDVTERTVQQTISSAETSDQLARLANQLSEAVSRLRTCDIPGGGSPPGSSLPPYSSTIRPALLLSVLAPIPLTAVSDSTDAKAPFSSR